MCAQIGQPGIGRQSIDNHFACRARQYGLSALREVSRPCRPIDCRTGVVASVAQLDVAGAHPDPQPDRRQQCPL